MFKLSVMYPNQEGAEFDYEYYRTTHMEMVHKHLKPFGLIKTGVDKGISGGDDQPAPYACIGHLYFESLEGFQKGMAKAGPTLRADVPNFTTIAPVRQVSEVLD